MVSCTCHGNNYPNCEVVAAMKLEHFWYGLTNGDGNIFKRSNKVLSTLTPKNLEVLQGLKANKDFQVNWLPTEQIVAVSSVENAKDRDGRQGVTNHTLLIPIKQYLQITPQPNAVFKKMSMFEVPVSNVLEPLEVNP